jgi:hypothetical protein
VVRFHELADAKEEDETARGVIRGGGARGDGHRAFTSDCAGANPAAPMISPHGMEAALALHQVLTLAIVGSSPTHLIRDRPMAGRWFLVPAIEVRILVPKLKSPRDHVG